MKVSPKYMVTLLKTIGDELWKIAPEGSKYQMVESYMKRWQEDIYNVYDEPIGKNFEIIRRPDNDCIDLMRTLSSINDDMLLIKIATDLGIETPGLLPITPEKFKNTLSNINTSAENDFKRAIELLYEKPAESIAIATSALDGLTITIINSGKLQTNKKPAGKKLTERMSFILKTYKQNHSDIFTEELKATTGNLNGLTSSIDNVRGRGTPVHGRENGKKLADDTIFASLVVNSVSTLGLFIWDFFNKYYK